MSPGDGKINYVALRILNENCSTLASDKRPSFIHLLKSLFQKNINRISKIKAVTFC